MDREFLRAIADHDQDLAEIKNTVDSTHPEALSEFLELLDTDSFQEFRDGIAEAPDQWLWFIQKCTLAGLRQAFMGEVSDE